MQILVFARPGIVESEEAVMQESTNDKVIYRKKDETRGDINRGGGSISAKISFSLLAVLIPSLIILIITSCIIAASSISELNKKNLDLQTDYAVSIVDDFFSSKLAAVSMLERNTNLQNYFQAVSKPQDIEVYRNKDEVIEELSYILERFSSENIQRVWVVDSKTDCYLLSTGEVVNADLENTDWYKNMGSSKKAMVTEPYVDVITGELIISIVSPVTLGADAQIAGYAGFDVFMNSLSESLAGIKVGENGYLELLSNSSDYIYSDDPTAIGKNVSSLDISDDYKNKVLSNYNGIVDFSYSGIAYTSMFRNSQTTEWLAIATLPLSEVNATRNQLIFILVVLSIILLCILVFIIVSMIRRMMKPLTEISDNMKEFARGNLGIDIKVSSNDEIGRLADSTRDAIHTLKDIINDISHILKGISTGNLQQSVDGDYAGDFFAIKEALGQIIQSLNATLGQINMSADQVSSGSDQVSAGAQALSQGATEQASSVEELAATINEISNQITSNAGRAAEASKMAENVGNEAAESNRRMQQMLDAMDNISTSSREIGKIIKTIEDIAFQTNILALNAAVEAARAGEAGKGFAVVADEVRNLASKSAEASNNTTVLIEGSLQAVENGTMIADETAKSLQNVLEGVKNVADTIDGISSASNEQARSVKQVTQGIEQISSVVQTNSATAEESAAASEELSGQAQLLRELIGKFQIKDVN